MAKITLKEMNHVVDTTDDIKNLLKVCNDLFEGLPEPVRKHYEMVWHDINNAKIALNNVRHDAAHMTDTLELYEAVKC